MQDKAPVRIELLPSSESLFILFGGMAGTIGMPPFEFYKTSQILYSSKIFVRDIAQAWYQRGLPAIGDDVFAIRDFLQRQINDSGASKIRFVGNSMGGFAAILFCSLLNCGKAIAFSPQTFISLEKREKYGDDRWSRQIDKLHSHKFETDIYDLQPWLRGRAPEIQADLYVSSSDALDNVHANELTEFRGIRIHRFAAGGHHLVKRLRDDGSLVHILNE